MSGNIDGDQQLGFLGIPFSSKSDQPIASIALNGFITVHFDNNVHTQIYAKVVVSFVSSDSNILRTLIPIRSQIIGNVIDIPSFKKNTHNAYRYTT